METTKTIPKNKIKNIKGQPIENQLKKNQKYTKNKNRLLFFWGPQSFSIFSCYALAALQSPTITAINQDIHHKTAPWSTISTWSSASNTKWKKRSRLGGSTYRSRKSLQQWSIIIRALTNNNMNNLGAYRYSLNDLTSPASSPSSSSSSCSMSSPLSPPQQQFGYLRHPVKKGNTDFFHLEKCFHHHHLRVKVNKRWKNTRIVGANTTSRF